MGKRNQRLRAKALKDTQPVGADVDVQYRRKDMAELLIPEIVIGTVLTPAGKLSDRVTYQLLWVIPDGGDDTAEPPQLVNRGSLVHLDRFHITIKNVGLMPVQVAVQQPYGYEQAPASVASWAFRGEGLLGVGKQVSYTIVPMDNNFVVPLRAEHAGQDCIVILAMCMARQAAGPGVSSTGQFANTEAGLWVNIDAHYTSNGHDVSSGEFFGLRKFTTDDVMFSIDPKPPVPLAVSSLALGARRMQLAKTDDGRLTMELKNGKGETVGKENWHGINTAHVYRLPFAYRGVATGNKKRDGLYLKWSKACHGC